MHRRPDTSPKDKWVTGVVCMCVCVEGVGLREVEMVRKWGVQRKPPKVKVRNWFF